MTLTKPKPKKQRGYGQAQEGRGGYAIGGAIEDKDREFTKERLQKIIDYENY